MSLKEGRRKKYFRRITSITNQDETELNFHKGKQIKFQLQQKKKKASQAEGNKGGQKGKKELAANPFS